MSGKNVERERTQLGLFRTINLIRVVFPFPENRFLFLIIGVFVIDEALTVLPVFDRLKIRFGLHGDVVEVCGERKHVYAVYLAEFLFLRNCCAGHARQFVVHAEIVL